MTIVNSIICDLFLAKIRSTYHITNSKQMAYSNINVLRLTDGLYSESFLIM